MTRPRASLIIRVIASAVPATLCVMVLVLWARSYWWLDVVGGPWNPGANAGLFSSWGKMGAQCWVASSYPYSRWEYRGAPRPPALRRNSSSRLLHVLWESDCKAISAPHWFAFVLLAVAAYVPWIRRFTLREMLLAMTLVGSVIGWILFMMRQSR